MGGFFVIFDKPKSKSMKKLQELTAWAELYKIKKEYAAYHKTLEQIEQLRLTMNYYGGIMWNPWAESLGSE